METARAVEPPAVPSLWAEEDPTEAPPAEEAAPAPAPPRRRRRWRWLLVALLALGAAGGGVAAFRARGTKPAVSFETVPVSRGRIVVQVTASGTVSALKTVLVGSQVSGRVAELHADFNDNVKKGQLLARLDTQLYAAALEQARANQALVRSNVAKAEAQLADAQRTLARQKTLGDAHYLAAEVVESAASAAEVARATLAGARAQARQSAASVHQAELNLAMTAIYSPIDGVVISRSVDVGQTVAASLQAPTLFTLAEDLRKMQVEAHVSESDVARLTAGMPVTFTVDAFPGRPFVGKLRQVRNAAETVQNVVTYDAIVDVDNASLELRPGMTANVTFVVAERDRALRIPNAALRFRPPRAASEGGARTPAADRRVVFTREGDGVRPVRVRVGVTDGSFTELVEGPLAEGTPLVSDMSDSSKPSAPRGARAGGAGQGGPGGGMGVPGVGGPGMGMGGGSRGRGTR